MDWYRSNTYRYKFGSQNFNHWLVYLVSMNTFEWCKIIRFSKNGFPLSYSYNVASCTVYSAAECSQLPAWCRATRLYSSRAARYRVRFCFCVAVLADGLQPCFRRLCLISSHMRPDIRARNGRASEHEWLVCSSSQQVFSFVDELYCFPFLATYEY